MFEIGHDEGIYSREVSNSCTLGILPSSQKTFSSGQTPGHARQKQDTPGCAESREQRASRSRDRCSQERPHRWLSSPHSGPAAQRTFKREGMAFAEAVRAIYGSMERRAGLEGLTHRAGDAACEKRWRGYVHQLSATVTNCRRKSTSRRKDVFWLTVSEASVHELAPLFPAGGEVELITAGGPGRGEDSPVAARTAEEEGEGERKEPGTRNTHSGLLPLTTPPCLQFHHLRSALSGLIHPAVRASQSIHFPRAPLF